MTLNPNEISEIITLLYRIEDKFFKLGEIRNEEIIRAIATLRKVQEELSQRESPTGGKGSR